MFEFTTTQIAAIIIALEKRIAVLESSTIHSEAGLNATREALAIMRAKETQ